MTLRSLLSFCLFYLPMALFAQKDKPLRIEFPLAKDAEDYQSIQIGEEGVFVFYEGNLLSIDSSTWIFMHYDTNLNKKANYTFTLPSNILHKQSYFDGQTLYLLFQDQYHRKTTVKSYIAEIDVASKGMILHGIPELSDLNINFFKSAGDHIIMISYFKNSYNIYLFDKKRNTLSSPEFAKEPLRSIEFCEVDTFHKTILWGLVFTESSKFSLWQLIKTQFDGSEIERLPFIHYQDYAYHAARMAIVDSSKSLIMGTYTDLKENPGANVHTGVYTMLYDYNNLSAPEFFKYTQIKNKLGGETSTSKAKSKDKQGNLQILVGDIHQYGKNYSLVTEIFYPEYSYYDNSMTYYDPYYNYRYYSTPTTSTFLGYRYINAYVTTFNEDGQLIWDTYLPFKNLITQNVVPRVFLFPFLDNTVVYYTYNVSITYTMLQGDEIIEPLTTNRMPALNAKDYVEYTRHPKFEKWYDNYFLSSGFQYIKSGKESRSDRYVFFLSKIEYR